MLHYATLDIFFLMYLGNEIKLSSSKLAYCLFESNWLEQTTSCKSTILVLAEVLKRHQQIMVAKLYSLSLETFNSVNSVRHLPFDANKFSFFFSNRLCKEPTACSTF